MREILRIKQWYLIGLENDKKTGSTFGLEQDKRAQSGPGFRICKAMGRTLSKMKGGAHFLYSKRLKCSDVT